MNVGVAHSELNPNSSWLSGRGSWIAYGCGVLLLHLIIRSIPFLHGPIIWTATNVIHNTIMYIMLHFLKGAPWETADQGKNRRLTHWEQIDAGQQCTGTRKFLTAVPIALFMLTSYSTHYEWSHFMVNLAFLVLVTLPKLPQFHKVRIWDINKY